MSAYAEQETQFKDAELLIASLKEIGISEVQFHAIAKNLEGYHGDRRPETAEVIIPRRAVGMASNDIGFKIGPDGCYHAIISEFDSRSYDRDWMTKLTVTYAKHGIMQAAKKAGFRVIGTKKVLVNGKMQTQLQYLKG